MDKKTYTILVSSNRRGETRSFCLAASWLKGVLVLSVILFVLFSAMAVDYVGLLLETGENKRLRAENSLLTRQFQVIESKVNSLENSLERIRVTEAKLRRITDVDQEDRTIQLAMGSSPKAGQAFLEFNRDGEKNSSEFLSKDSLFLEKPPLDIAKKELSRAKTENYALLSIRIDRVVKTSGLREQGIIELYETLSERESLLNSTPSIKPARGWYTSRFGYRIDPFSGKPVMHQGLDIAAPPGTPVKSPADGVVSYVGYESGYGKLVAIDHGYGVKTRFAHNSQIFVEVGQKVKRWDVISAVGNTGRSSGPHVHYEVRVHGVPIDPTNYILND
ncbi:MAG: M23 family metallopeptidase [Bdellovibrionales bacterium]|nr:M23 family metallopeptidase [Bdellovibrionales bacterium]